LNEGHAQSDAAVSDDDNNKMTCFAYESGGVNGEDGRNGTGWVSKTHKPISININATISFAVCV